MFSSAGKTVLAGEWGGDTVAWSLASGREVMRLSRTMPLSINPAGTLVATSEGVVKIPSGEFAIERPRTSLYCETGPFSRDGSAVALPGRHNPDPNSPRQPNDWHSFMDVFNVGTGQFVARLAHGPHPIVSAQFTHDLRAFVTADGNSDAIVWELSTGRQEFKLPHAEGAWWIYVEPNGSRMMTVEPRTASAHLWNLLDQTNIRSFLHAQPDIPYDPAVWASDVSRDFKLLATAGYDQTVRIWNIDSGTEVSRCTHQSMYIDNVVFSPDGQLIATSARDETRDAGGKTWDTIRLFDASNGTELETMLFSTVKDLRFDSEGTCIAATGLDTEYVPNGSGEDPLPCAAVWLLSSGESTKRIAPPDSNKLEYEYDESSDRWTHKSC
ncbi:MAG: hypothetical protein MPJ50_05925 [Pirellulales bacterium]|nr:hypothetical protein [Pirellulales bacterium]